MSYERHAQLLAAIFVVVWIALGIKPWYRQDWILENVLVVVAAWVFVAAYRRRLFSRLSHSLIFAFLCLHEIGAHYTYSEVPYDQWWRALTGHSINEAFGWQRNHFDRLAHFLYGLLLAYPIREIFLRIVRVKGFWGYFLPLDLTMSTSLFYELVEWLAASVLGGDLGQAYLGTQGDIWDAHKDMSLAILGALISMLVTAAVNYKCQRDFAREWSESWKVRGENRDFVA